LKFKILLGLLLILAVLQILPREKNENRAPSDSDLFKVEEATLEIEELIIGACYDCHSYQSKYPWYSNVAPLSWWIDDHISHARKHLNFSEWLAYKADKKSHKAEECFEEVEEGEMPLESYRLAHASGRLSEGEKFLLLNWFKGLQQKYQ